MLQGDSFFEEIKRKGDSLWDNKLSDRDEDGDLILFDPTHHDPEMKFFSLVEVVYNRFSEGDAPVTVLTATVLTAAVLILGPIDIVSVGFQWLFFWIIGYHSVLGMWYAERALARLFKRDYFCPLCHNPMSEPLVYCSGCERVQTQLRPTVDSILWTTCPECETTRWFNLGNYLIRRPKPLICRSTSDYLGCYHPHLLPTLAGKYQSQHVALLGTAFQSKHAFMAHQLLHLIDEQNYEPAWPLSDLEANLCRSHLQSALVYDTSKLETLGKRYTLARSFILRRPRGRCLLVFHNMANRWISKDQGFVKSLINFDLIREIIFVVDEENVLQESDGNPMSHAEVYSRMLRRIEHNCDLDPGEEIRKKLAFVLPLGSQSRLMRYTDAQGAMSSEDVEAFMSGNAPTFYNLIQKTTHPRRVRYFGGRLHDTYVPGTEHWLASVVKWMK